MTCHGEEYINGRGKTGLFVGDACTSKRKEEKRNAEEGGWVSSRRLVWSDEVYER